MEMQLRFATDLSPNKYVKEKAWKSARLDQCPLHPDGGCGFSRNGTYPRKNPEGTKIARWYCPTGRTTFSMLPDCLSSRLSGSLDEVEAVIVEVENSPSQEVAADKLRIDIELPGVLRWIRRRILPVRAALTKLIKLLPSLFTGCTPTILSFRSALYVDHILIDLRVRASLHLHILPPPIGFGPHPEPRKSKKIQFQQEMGPDPPIYKI